MYSNLHLNPSIGCYSHRLSNSWIFFGKRYQLKFAYKQYEKRNNIYIVVSSLFWKLFTQIFFLLWTRSWSDMKLLYEMSQKTVADIHAASLYHILILTRGIVSMEWYTHKSIIEIFFLTLTRLRVCYRFLSDAYLNSALMPYHVKSIFYEKKYLIKFNFFCFSWTLSYSNSIKFTGLFCGYLFP